MGSAVADAAVDDCSDDEGVVDDDNDDIGVAVSDDLPCLPA